ncbi:hypothetical protein EYB26_005313 [Talaromyces marneffei]|uniref:uncharacterized protein n=1 Tax=Talaromyces marneffei TaxID=37727 RepID=UPI0012A82F1E|nr:uncharacterized protein EYB26_005313 [Talaromyces marneffei]QGA17638.1 hypothetical protein EYB26_005313 [Talaromyces marneffei]
MSGLTADQFTKMPPDTSPQGLLEHPFLRLGQDSWYLSHLGLLHSYYLQTQPQVGSSEGEETGNEENSSESENSIGEAN